MENTIDDVKPVDHQDQSSPDQKANENSTQSAPITSPSKRDNSSKSKGSLDDVGEPSGESSLPAGRERDADRLAGQSPTRKRVRKAGEGSGEAAEEPAGKNQGGGGVEVVVGMGVVVEGLVGMYPCPWEGCDKVFTTKRALFGHLRTHPQRTWRGAFPPPVFSRAEFEYTGLLNPLLWEDEEEEEEGDQGDGEVLLPPPLPKVADAGGGVAAVEAAPRVAAHRVREIDLNVAQFYVPDLNLLPPENDVLD